MAARNLKKQIAHFIPDPILILGKGTGAAAADLTALAAPGVSLVDQTGTGLYNIVLEDKYNTFLHASFGVIDPGTVDDWEVQVVAETVATTKLISIAVFKGGTLTDLTTDEKLTFAIFLSNSARPR